MIDFIYEASKIALGIVLAIPLGVICSILIGGVVMILKFLVDSIEEYLHK